MDFSVPDDSAARNRFETFKLGKGLPSAKHGHSRSHSRNTSFSFPKSASVNDISAFSFPASPSPTLPPSPSHNSLTNTVPNPIPPSKRNSHHRRRSSVSTRHESAEMMGVALPDLPALTSDDNINLGEKDSIRRRALWALEGKPDVSFNKVEIPDISTPDIEKMMFDFSTKSSSYGTASKRDSFKLLGPSSSAKDQLGTLLEEEEEEEEVNPLPSPAPSVKEELPPPNTPITPNTPLTPALSFTKATPAKPRPSNLNLRPLSLTPDSVVASLPSPSPTPSPRQGLRSLALTPSSSTDDNAIDVKQSRRSSLVISPTPSSRRPVLNLSLESMDKAPSTSEEEQKPSRRSSISYKKSHNSVTMNIAGLPTPEMTPTFGRRYSTTESLSSISNDDEVFPNPPTQTRPLSASEQHFLFKSHNALLARITDLERALSMRRRESGGYSNGGSSRPASVASNFSSSSAGTSGVNGSQVGEPSDEMLNLIADLKSERDELKRDVDGWRTRVGDMENQMSVLAKRVENERRDAWVARSRVGLLEVEKGVLTQKMEALDELLAIHDKEKSDWESQVGQLRKENSDSKQWIRDLEAQVELLKLELVNERAKDVKEETDPLMTPTPRSFDSFKKPGMGLPAKKHGLGFASVDSESSVTDVEQDSSDDCHAAFGFALKSVQEESEEGDEDDGLAGYEDEDDDDSGLAGYEDEEDTDMSLQSSSSFDSEEDLPRSVVHLQNAGLPSSPTTPRPQVFTPRSNHARRATLSKTWIFPFGSHPQTPPKMEEDETVDRFFGCLDDGESDTAVSVPNSPSAYSYEKSKGLFASGFKFAAADDNASFFLPDGVGTLADSEEDSDKEDKRLSVVAEEEATSETAASGVENIDDDDDDLFGEEIGGIRITFTPPQEEPMVEERKQIQLSSPITRTSPPPVLPALNFGDGNDEDDDEEEEEEDQDGIRRVIPFNFGRPLKEERQPSPPPPVSVSVPVVPTPLPSLARPASPSMIPRPASPSSPSSIPRLVTSKTIVVTPVPVSVPESTPRKVSPLRTVPASFVTPPNKRGGVTPSFIPQLVSSPSPLRSFSSSTATSTTTKPRVVPTSTFIRQPAKKPLLPTASSSKVQNNNTGNSNGSTMIPHIPSIPVKTGPFRRSPNEPAALPAADFFDVSNNNNHSAQMKSVDLSYDSTFSSPPSRSTVTATTNSTTRIPRTTVSSSSNASSSISSIVSSPLSARLSFQTITNFMPLSWTSTLTPAGPACHASASSLDDDDTIVPAATAIRRRSGAFVSRELQLRKLQTRMEFEGVMVMRMAVQFQCRKCDGNAVFI